MRNRLSHHPSIRRTGKSFVLALLAAFAVLMSACGADEDSESATAAPPPAPEPAAAPADSADAAFDEQAASAPPAAPVPISVDALGAPTALGPVDFGRDIVYTATITVEADDVAAAGRLAVDIVQELGGIVFAQQTLTEPEPVAEMTFKLRPADFATALQRLAGVGELVDQTVSAEDVTDRIVDLESRITTAAASVERLRAFLEQAAELEEVAQLERELLERETVLETLRGQLRTLQGLVDLATITLTINQSPDLLPEAAILVTASVTDNPDDQCLGNHHVAVEPDATVYFCVEVENVGRLGPDRRASQPGEPGHRRRLVPGDSRQLPPDRARRSAGGDAGRAGGGGTPGGSVGRQDPRGRSHGRGRAGGRKG